MENLTMGRKVIGIDFGSSQSSIAIMEIGSVGTPELLNVGGGRGGVTIPTLLALDPNDDTVISYGNNVKKHYREEKGSINFQSHFKRKLGPGNKEHNMYCKLFLKELAEFVKERFVVKSLSSEDYVTCLAYPATWSEEQIALLKQYAQEAGFPADDDEGIYAIPEPVAAMYTLTVQTSEKLKFGNKPEHYMVIDFGGGTLDICIIKTGILGTNPKIISTSGDPKLGGEDFDEIIKLKFFRNNSDCLKEQDLTEREKAELNDKVKEAKEAFSENFAMNDFATQPFHLMRGQYSLTLSKQELKNLCADRAYFDNIKKSIHEALDKANIGVAEIKKVILTGGSSKWFFMREIVAKEFALEDKHIFLTQNPFTDVANGCAINIALPKAPPENKGVWVSYKVDDSTKWSTPKCILAPGRNISTETELMFLGTIVGTQYVAPYKITLAWWTGLEEDKLEKSDNEAIIEFYARSNMPFMDRLRGAWRGLQGQENKPMPDEYQIYLRYQEDKAGSKKYHFEIMDATAAAKEAKRLRGEDVSNVPDGVCEKGDVLPGFISYRGLAGAKTRKLMPLVNGGK